jgi:hypothetical protein
VNLALTCSQLSLRKLLDFHWSDALEVPIVTDAVDPFLCSPTQPSSSTAVSQPPALSWFRQMMKDSSWNATPHLLVRRCTNLRTVHAYRSALADAIRWTDLESQSFDA